MERVPEAILFDKEHMHEYIAVRIDHAEDVQRTGEIIANSEMAEDVFVALRRDQKQNMRSQYYFYKPATLEDHRDGWFVAPEPKDLAV